MGKKLTNQIGINNCLLFYSLSLTHTKIQKSNEQFHSIEQFFFLSLSASIKLENYIIDDKKVNDL